MKVGTRKFIKDNLEISETYLKIARQDEAAAKKLEECGLFNQAGYFYIQAMEKYIKSRIVTRINAMNPYIADEISKTVGHSLDDSFSLLVKIFAGNDALLSSQMKQQISSGILKGVRFEQLHNSVRYPIYIKRYEDYLSVILTKSDCAKLAETLQRLKRYLDGLDRF